MKVAKLICSIIVLTSVLFPVTAAYAQNISTEVCIEVEKQLEGDVPSSPEEYVFTLQAEGNAPMPSENTVTIRGAGSTSFPGIVYTTPETYHYTVEEIKGNSPGCFYDSSIYDVTVQITTDDKGNLSSAVSANKQGSASKVSDIVFVNKYTFQEGIESSDGPGKGDGSSAMDDGSYWGILTKTGDFELVVFAVLAVVVFLASMLVLVCFKKKD